jgi:mannose-6-phosphate isomerase-like protein (cupin superfamily)
MARPGQTTHNPVTGERFRWHQTQQDTDGELARAEVWVSPGGGVFVEHVHPRSEERFEVLSGRMILERDGAEQVLVAGQEARVTAGTPHRWRNGSCDELHLFLELHDPQGFEDMIEEVFAAARAGATNAEGRMRLLPGAAMLRRHARNTRPATPPAAVQRVIVPPLALLARVVGKA